FTVFAPEKIPFDHLGPFGSFCRYLVDNHADLMYKGWWAAFAAHVFEGIYALKVCRFYRYLRLGYTALLSPVPEHTPTRLPLSAATGKVRVDASYASTESPPATASSRLFSPAWVQSGPETLQSELMRQRVMGFAEYLRIFPEDVDFVHLILEAEFLGRGWLDAPAPLSSGGPFSPLLEAVSAVAGSTEAQPASSQSSEPQPAASGPSEPQPASSGSSEPRLIPEEPVDGLPPLPRLIPEEPVGGLPSLPRHVPEEPEDGLPPLPRLIPEEPVGGLPPLPRLIPEEPEGGLPPQPGPEHHLAFLWGVLMELKPDTPEPVSDTEPDTPEPVTDTEPDTPESVTDTEPDTPQPHTHHDTPQPVSRPDTPQFLEGHPPCLGDLQISCLGPSRTPGSNLCRPCLGPSVCRGSGHTADHRGPSFVGSPGLIVSLRRPCFVGSPGLVAGLQDGCISVTAGFLDAC
ncbi:hypothetical protein ILYODFUR_028094, partial [Ilyodon furcidens]